MRLSDAGLHRRQTELIYLDHRPTPWLTEDTPRDRSNRLLGVAANRRHDYPLRVVLEYIRAPIRMETRKPSGNVSINQYAAL
jgi:hypothetical protein